MPTECPGNDVMVGSVYVPCFSAAIEEQYLELLRRRESKEAAFQDVKAELDGLLAEIERYSKRLGELLAREEVASEVVGTCPEKIAELKDKLKSAAQLL